MENGNRLYEGEQKNILCSDLQKKEMERYYKSCLQTQTMWRFMQALSAVIMVSAFANHLLKKEDKINVGRACLASASGVVFCIARHKDKRYAAEITECQKELAE